jgi:uncharacterized Zn finger protein
MDVRMILAKVDGQRLQRAVRGLESGAFQVYVEHRDQEHVDGSVLNGDGQEYAVNIGNGYASCDCPDAVYRKVACKHVLAMALQLQRAEEEMPAS